MLWRVPKRLFEMIEMNVDRLNRFWTQKVMCLKHITPTYKDSMSNANIIISSHCWTRWSYGKPALPKYQAAWKSTWNILCSRFNWWTSTTSSGLALSWSFLGVRPDSTRADTHWWELGCSNLFFPLQDSQAEASFLSAYKAPVKGYLLPWQWMVPLWSSMQVYLNRFITPHDISTQPDTGKSHGKLWF